MGLVQISENEYELPRSGAMRVPDYPGILWCPADPRRGEPGYTSYTIVNDVPGSHDAAADILLIECRHHGPRVVRGYADGHATVETRAGRAVRGSW